MTYVRQQSPKAMAATPRIEVKWTEGQRFWLVEDLTTDGGYKDQLVDGDS